MHEWDLICRELTLSTSVEQEMGSSGAEITFGGRDNGWRIYYLPARIKQTNNYILCTLYSAVVINAWHGHVI